MDKGHPMLRVIYKGDNQYRFPFYVLKQHSKSPGTRINTGFPSSIFLLELYRSWRFARQIVEYSVYAFDFVDNSVHNFIKNFVW